MSVLEKSLSHLRRVFPIEKFLYTEMNVFALIILVLIFFNVNRRTDKYMVEQRLFLALIGTDALILILDSAMWLLDGKPGNFVRVFYLLITACYYALNPVICLLWTFYADYQIFRSEKHLRKLLLPMSVPIFVNLILSFLSIPKGYLFAIDADNIYSRGSIFYIMVAISFFYLMYTLILLIRRQSKVQQNAFFPMLLFAFPPVVGAIVQTRFYHVSLIWVCVTISIFIVFINIQNHQLYTDYLTGLFNRRELDNYLHQIQGYTEERLLAGLMIDLDSFKSINDLYGHDVGDEALRCAAKILKSTFRKNDFIARYGGDEFVVLMDVTEVSALNRAVLRLKENIKQFNAQKAVPYTLSLSVGYDLYTPMPGFTLQKFLKHLDGLMYQEKQKRNVLLEVM